MRSLRSLFALFALASTSPAADTPAVRHSYLVMGTKTAIISEAGEVEWEHAGRTRDGFVLPDGHILLAYQDRVEEITRAKKIVFSYKLSTENKEIGTTQRLDNGNTLITELGARPRLLEVDTKGQIVIDVPLQPETDNVHMQTRMARIAETGNYLVPHLLAFALKEYSPDGKVVNIFKTDVKELDGRAAENWPFTAIRLENGNTVSSLTHGNKVVEWNTEGKIVWTVTNDDVKGDFRDTCGAQRLANGNTVIGSHGAKTGISMVEVMPDKRVVWTSDHPFAARIHHFQILTTNGKPEPGVPMK
ncbi:MAG: hypothetical protein KDK97_14700 [Verrucomicrobiales bacterium]|nr:hypothetical protein [Verrucomicrobiales bacterium]